MSYERKCDLCGKKIDDIMDNSITVERQIGKVSIRYLLFRFVKWVRDYDFHIHAACADVLINKLEQVKPVEDKSGR